MGEPRGLARLVVPADEDGGDEFGRLVWLLKSNDRLFAALRVSTERLRSVRAYLAEAGCNVFLGKASYAYWRTRRSSVLTLLRANRIEARRLLGRLDPGAFPRCSVSRAALGLSRQTDPAARAEFRGGSMDVNRCALKGKRSKGPLCGPSLARHEAWSAQRTLHATFPVARSNLAVAWTALAGARQLWKVLNRNLLI